jgi:hypothetical protein
MKRNSFRLLVLSLVAALLAAAASAGDVDRLVVNIPYNFVVSGKTLPAGTYTVQRLSDYDEHPLSISCVEHRTAAIIVSGEVEPAIHDHPAVTFLNSGDQHFLTRIQTGEHVFNLHVSNKAVQEAANAQSLSGTSETTKH